MKTTEQIFEILTDKFGDSVIEHIKDVPVEEMIIINPLKIQEVGLFLRDTAELEFDSLMNLSGVDDNNATKEKDEEGNVKEVGRTLSIYYHLDSVKLKHKVTLRVSCPIETPDVESVESVWKTADWHEREAYDMYGLNFLSHPNLIRILMPYDWDAGFPLRKDYKSPEYYQGMKIPY